MVAPYGRYLNVWRKSLSAITQEYSELYGTSLGDNIPQNRSYTAIDYPSRNLSNSDETDMWDTAGEVRTKL